VNVIEYRCELGHESAAPSNLKLTACPLAVHGKVCALPVRPGRYTASGKWVPR